MTHRTRGSGDGTDGDGTDGEGVSAPDVDKWTAILLMSVFRSVAGILSHAPPRAMMMMLEWRKGELRGDEEELGSCFHQVKSDLCREVSSYTYLCIFPTVKEAR